MRVFRSTKFPIPIFLRCSFNLTYPDRKTCVFLRVLSFQYFLPSLPLVTYLVIKSTILLHSQPVGNPSHQVALMVVAGCSFFYVSEDFLTSLLHLLDTSGVRFLLHEYDLSLLDLLSPNCRGNLD